ncbi:hypothetical protein BGZ81_011554 [Podila clonocystis]|nr:hypothetical protein BGZ81_011554 [Podila clonocystis]
MSRKLGVLVAIPIKGRKLVNRSGGKQSPYIQLKLGDDKKRTKASLIASVRFDVFQNHLDLHVMVIDEGKKNEVIGDGVLLLHEVIDKGELDVWFPIKYKGSPAGDIYFELTFYAAGLSDYQDLSDHQDLRVHQGHQEEEEDRDQVLIQAL